MNKKLALILLLLLSVLAYWFTFITKIGLHVDEAWLGLDGIKILESGITRPYGMNNYTGLLQSLLNAVTFQLFGVSITVLRISGIIANSISLVCILWFLIKKVNTHSALFFVLLFAQSGLFLCYGKVAWEVCSFNFFFLTLSIISLYYSSKVNIKNTPIWLFLFLTLSLLGVYNHILFFSVIIAAFLGLFFWRVNNSTKYDKIIMNALAILFLSACNAFFLHATMRLFIEWLWALLGVGIFLIPPVFIGVQYVLFKKYLILFESLFQKVFKIRFHPSLKVIVPLLFLLSFLFFHAITLFQIISKEVIFLRVFSENISLVYQVLFYLTAITILGLSVYYLVRDILKNTNTPWSFLLVTYLGVFCLFTQGYSVRYFLLLLFFLFLFLAVKISFESKKLQLIFSLVLIFSVLLVQSLLWGINLEENRQVKAKLFSINNEEETSAHFMNFTPVIDFIHENKIKDISTKEGYFIGFVFKFYKASDPKIQAYSNSAQVDYDYKNKKTGFALKSIK